jgi:tagaturonate reductase
VSKFKVRVLPSILEYIKRYKETPKTLVFSLAKLIEFYKVGTPNDAPEVVEFIRTHEIGEILANEELFGQDIAFLKEEIEKCR